MLAARREYHAQMAKAKRQHWQDWLEAANEKSIWNAHKYVANASLDTTATKTPTLNHKGSSAETNEQKGKVLREVLFPPPPTAQLDDISEAVYDQPLEDIAVDELEVRNVISSLPPFKAPGPSGIINAAIQRLSPELTPILTRILNACLKHGHYPSRWKHFSTIVLRKPGKPDYTIPKAYRPIALEETLGKVCEAVITRRLSNLAEVHGLLPANQFGARPGRTTTDAILTVTNMVKDAQRSHEVTSVLFLDISQAFPNVNATRLCHNLRRRRVPENIVRLVSSFLKDRTTTLSFDDYTSPSFAASNGIPQGSPLSPILYLFYSADLLEITEPHRGPSRPRELTAGFVDDSTFIVSSPSFRENMEKMKVLVQKALEWAKLHACQFDINKFILVHFLSKQATYTKADQDIPLQIGDVLVHPSDTAKYLGVTLDKHLNWRAHVDTAAAKGMATVLAIGRLTKTSFGLPPKYVGRLFKSVALPRMEYGLVAWYEPVRIVEGERRRRGKVGFAKKLNQVQRLASTLITGALRTTSTAVLEYHAFLPPIHLHLNRAIHDATIRIACLPPSHPLHAAWRSTRNIPRAHQTTIHRMKLAFPHTRKMEIIDPSLSDPSWIPPMRTHIAESKDIAVEDISTKYANYTVIYSDGSGYKGGVGSAAVTLNGEGNRTTRRLYLGPITEHTVYEAEVTGIILATDIIAEIKPVGQVIILLDNQAAIRSVGKRKHHSGQALVLAAQEAISNLLNLHPSITLSIAWVPGHVNVPGNEAADEEAKKAAEGSSSRLFGDHQILEEGIPTSAAAAKATAKGIVAREWDASWRKCPQRERLAKFDARPPSKYVQKFYANLNRPDSSLVTQLRSGHIPLASYLHRIKAIDSGLCPRCQVPETVDHYLTKCERFSDQRSSLRKSIGRRPMCLSTLLGIPKMMKHTLAFVHATNRFPHLSRNHINPTQAPPSAPTP
jgi:ribonuclease HI